MGENMNGWVGEHMNGAFSLSENNAVDDDNPVGEDHQHLEETFDDLISIHWIHMTLHMI